MSKVLYYIIVGLSYLPFWFWYGVSDILFVLIYFLIGYRKKVVLGNLDIAFPEKSAAEKRKIAKRFYRHFTDFLIENIKCFSLRRSTLAKRFRLINHQDLSAHIRQHKKGVVVAISHQFNWEWMMNIAEYMPTQSVTMAAYTPLSNKSLDKLIQANRSRFGSVLVSSSLLPMQVKVWQEEGMWPIVGLIADQSPHASYKFWAPFFGVEVPVFTGIEILAKRFDLDVWFMHIHKRKRGYYEAHFELITDKSATYSKGELTALYLAKVEEQIKAQPETYLWSHRRWKHAKTISN